MCPIEKINMCRVHFGLAGNTCVQAFKTAHFWTKLLPIVRSVFGAAILSTGSHKWSIHIFVVSTATSICVRGPSMCQNLNVKHVLWHLKYVSPHLISRSSCMLPIVLLDRMKLSKWRILLVCDYGEICWSAATHRSCPPIPIPVIEPGQIPNIHSDRLNCSAMREALHYIHEHSSPVQTCLK